MHPQTRTEISQQPRNRYILPTLLTAIAGFFAVLFAGAKIAHTLNTTTDAPHSVESLAVVRDSVASR